MALLGLSFASGLKVQEDVGHSLGLPISLPMQDSSSFALVVAFGRCRFRPDSASMSSILQATIGGSSLHFHVSLLSNHTFKFFVSSKKVGFYISNLRSFSCQCYSLTFHLWGMAGPNWRREFELFLKEEARSWQPATKPRASVFTRLNKSFADVVRTTTTIDPLLSSTNSIPPRCSFLGP